MKSVGRHLILELWEAGGLDSPERVEEALRSAVEASRSTLLQLHVHPFGEGAGVSGVAIIAESHITVHTWPELGYVAADVFTCGEETDPEAAAEALRRAFSAMSGNVIEIKRGVLS